MKTVIETVINTENGVRVGVSDWGDEGAWLSLMVPGATCNVVLTRDEAQRLVDGLQAIIDATVEA